MGYEVGIACGSCDAYGPLTVRFGDRLHTFGGRLAAAMRVEPDR